MPEHKRQANLGARKGNAGHPQLQSPRRRLSCASSANDKPDRSPEFYMLKGITAVENDDLQRMANALEGRLLRRRIKEPGRLLTNLRSALQSEGFVRVHVRWSDTVLSFRAVLGCRKRALLRRLKVWRTDDVLYGHVTGAARRCGLDPRIEDIGVQQRKGRVEGTVSPVPFIIVSAAMDKMLDGWRATHGRKAPTKRSRASKAAT